MTIEYFSNLDYLSIFVFFFCFYAGYYILGVLEPKIAIMCFSGLAMITLCGNGIYSYISQQPLLSVLLFGEGSPCCTMHANKVLAYTAMCKCVVDVPLFFLLKLKNFWNKKVYGDPN